MPTLELNLMYILTDLAQSRADYRVDAIEVLDHMPATLARDFLAGHLRSSTADLTGQAVLDALAELPVRTSLGYADF